MRHFGQRFDLMLAYSYSKSLDQASSISDPVDPFNFRLTRALSAWDLTHNFVANYQYQLPLDRISAYAKSLTRSWTISGITRANMGFPVDISSDGDNSLTRSLPNGVNSHSLDRPDYTPGPLNLNHDPRNGLPYFNASLFSANALWTPGTLHAAVLRTGMVNFDLALLRSFALSESKSLQFRLETFNTFNHTQFVGPVAVDGDFNNSTFGKVVKAAPPRPEQSALKFNF